MIRETDSTWRAEVVPDPDALLREPGSVIATADAGILDRCGAWVNLAREIVEAEVPGAFVAKLVS